MLRQRAICPSRVEPTGQPRPLELRSVPGDKAVGIAPAQTPHCQNNGTEVNGQSPMMDSSHGGQEELAPVAGLCDGFHQSRAALAERVPGGLENHILKSQIKGRLRLSDGERATLAGMAKRLGRKALQEIACIAKPDTILAWYRKLVAQKFDGSKKRGLAGRPRVDAAIEALVVKLARENSGWGYDRIVGAVANLGHEISDQSVAISCGAMGSRPRRSVNKAQPGASSFTVLLSAHVRWVNRTLHGQRS